MNLAFSTLGCPQWPLSEVIDKAVAYSYQGVELRGLRETIYLPRAADFRGDRLRESRRRFEDAGLSVVSVSSSATLSRFKPRERDGALNEVREYVALAVELEAPFVRVFAGRLREQGHKVGSEKALVDNLAAAAEIAAEAGRKLILETHDDFIRSDSVARVISAVDHPAVGVLWDIHHPVRFENEDVTSTWEQIGGWVWHTHVKDSRLEGEGYVYTLLGEGDIPVRQSIELLHRGGYGGYICLEWEKRWHPEIAEPEVVFPQYARALREMIDEVEAGSGMPPSGK
jgi:sugar phosphate isomerase/epimerase